MHTPRNFLFLYWESILYSIFSIIAVWSASNLDTLSTAYSTTSLRSFPKSSISFLNASTHTSKSWTCLLKFCAVLLKLPAFYSASGSSVLMMLICRWCAILRHNLWSFVSTIRNVSVKCDFFFWVLQSPAASCGHLKPHQLSYLHFQSLQKPWWIPLPHWEVLSNQNANDRL